MTIKNTENNSCKRQMDVFHSWITFNLTSFLYNLVQVVLFAILGGVIGFVTGFGIVWLQDKGAFGSWQLLKSPDRVNHIIGTQIFNGILIQTKNGKYFSYPIHDRLSTGTCQINNDGCKVWNEVVPTSIDEWSPDGKTDCSFQSVGSWSSAPLRPSLAKASMPIECAFTWGFYGNYEYRGVSKIFYVLLDNGELWIYQIKIGVFDYATMEIYGCILGIFIGCIIGITILLRDRRANRKI